MIETLLLNFLFLLFPVIFLIFFENKINGWNSYIFTMLAATAMILCMSFPIKLDVGFIFDLRYVPFIIATLFSGYKMAFPLYVLLNLQRFFIGGEGVFHSFIFSTAVFITVPYFHRKFIAMPPKKRISFSASISFVAIMSYLLSLTFQFPSLNKEFWMISLFAVVTHIFAMLVIMIMIEQIIANKKAREAYLQAERLNVVSELSASVSHEIRNPLTVTSGFLQLLNKSENISLDEKNYIKYSLLELERAEKIVSDFLAFVKPQAENMVLSNMKQETEYAKNIMMPFANMHQVEIRFSFTNSLTKKYDKNQLQQCLINLYKNAIEAMKENGGLLSIEVYERSNNIMIKIGDTGCGMTEEEVANLGRPYYSTKTEGTGLGMLMVYSTINELKGSIEVESVKEKGTVFLLSIPADKS